MPDGIIKWVWVQSYPIKNSQGVIDRQGGFAQDITARRQIEKTLVESENRIRTVADNIPGSIVSR